MKKTSFFIILTAALAWSIIPIWARAADTAPRAQSAVGQLAQMGGGMMGRGGGYCGPGMGPGSQYPAGALQSGPDIFNAYCAGCHAGGGNSVTPNLPLKGSPLMENFSTFRSFVRNPRMPNGAPGPMPTFSSGQISDQQMGELYQFLKSRWGS
jgi:mono/diheme cytochrome c family protein